LICDTSAFTSKDAYIGITVGSDAEISPRQQILSTPYAIQAERSALATHHSNIIPTGSLQAFMGTVIPPGWLLCDGSEIDNDPKYDTLKAMIGDNVPNMKDMFVRGKSDSRSVGSYQSDQFQTHIHYLESWADYSGNGSANARNAGYGAAGPYGETIPTKRFDGDSRHGSETRPKNIAVNYIIKF